MPLDVVRLRDSDLAALSSAEGFRAAVFLWCAAWHQIPAASLPDDDRMLARLAGYGRDVEGWMMVKTEAMRGFVKCDDGRLYHAVIAEKANEAWKSKEDRRARVQAAIDAKKAKAKAEAEAKRECDGKQRANRNNERDDNATYERGEQRDDERSDVQGTGTGTGTGTGILSLKEQAVGLQAKNSGQKPPRERATKIDPGLVLTTEWREAAVGCGLPGPLHDREFAKFHDHHRAKGSKMLDWLAAWRTWARNSVEFAANRTRGSPGESPFPAGTHWSRD